MTGAHEPAAVVTGQAVRGDIGRSRRFTTIHHHEISSLRAQALHQHAGFVYLNGYLDGGKLPRKFDRQIRKQDGGGIRSEADPHLAQSVRPDQLDVAKKTARFEQDAPGTLDQHPAGGGGRHTACRAIEQLDIELVFQRLDTAAERRLTQMNPLRRTRETALLGERDEMRETPRIDLMHDLKRNTN